MKKPKGICEKCNEKDDCPVTAKTDVKQGEKGEVLECKKFKTMTKKEAKAKKELTKREKKALDIKDIKLKKFELHKAKKNRNGTITLQGLISIDYAGIEFKSSFKQRVKK